MRVFLISLFDEWCLGLRAISATMRRKGCVVRMAHLRGMPELNDEEGKDDPDGYHMPPASVAGTDFKALEKLAADFRPDLIGISVSFSQMFGLAAETTKRLRKAFPKALFMWGGADSTANPDVSAEHADIVIKGEGEGAVEDLLERLRAGKDYADIPNIWMMRDGQMIRNDIRPLDQNLDELPYPDFDETDKYWISGGELHERTWPVGSHLLTNYPVMATRGCPYACTFCCNSLYREMYGNKDYVRVRSVPNVMEEIRQYLRRHPNTHSVEFHDDVFGVRAEWLEEFAEVYPKEIGLPFFCYTYPSVCRPAFVDAIKKAGVGFVAMGLQTGSQRILMDVFGRKSPREKIIYSANLLKDAGIPVVLDLIGSNPFETDDDRLETLTLLLDLPRGYYILHETNPLAFYRNYPITQMAQKFECLTPMCEERNLAMAKPTNAFRFWNALLQFPQFPSFDRDAILEMAKDPYLREHPEIVEAMLKTLIEATYMPGTRLRRRDHEKEMEQELATLKGSRAMRMYFGMKKWVSHRLEKTGGIFTGWRSSEARPSHIA